MLNSNYKNYLINLLILIASVSIILVTLETFLRIKNHFIIDYDVEMWKYSKKLKIVDADHKINHTHKKNKSAKLQNVDIKINSIGMRGSEIDIENWNSAELKILFLGSSIMLGWGVNEEDVLNNVIENTANKDNKNWATLNSGVGNYNTERYIGNFFKYNQSLNPDIIIIQYFINDAEILNSNRGNFLTSNFHLGVLLWRYFSLFKDEISRENIEDYYKEIYKAEEINQIVKKNLSKIQSHCNENSIRCILVYTPDIDLLKSGYELNFIKSYISKVVEEIDMEFIDVSHSIKLNIEKKMTNSEYNDRHPNNIGHETIGKTIYNYLVN